MINLEELFELITKKLEAEEFDRNNFYMEDIVLKPAFSLQEGTYQKNTTFGTSESYDETLKMDRFPFYTDYRYAAEKGLCENLMSVKDLDIKYTYSLIIQAFFNHILSANSNHFSVKDFAERRPPKIAKLVEENNDFLEQHKIHNFRCPGRCKSFFPFGDLLFEIFQLDYNFKKMKNPEEKIAELISKVLLNYKVFVILGIQ